MAPVRLELWGGVECTIQRVGDRYGNQMERSGHVWRLDDLDRLAALGIRTLRYPLLWEHIAPDGLEQADWRWADARMHRLRALGIRPIIGLVHHGSGPRHTSLADPGFAAGLAAYAGAVAARYPWVDAYTPVNEPLTTARFSGLYGHWYPHARDERQMALMLLHECRAVTLAMAAIRQVNPDAQLIQTEDLGKTYSTPALAYQAELENERRWCSLDLLMGQFTTDRPYLQHLRSLGMPQAELDWFQVHPCPPDIIGINHYLTSERWLDERLERYPQRLHGGNDQQAYADVEAVRVVADGPGGHAVLLREAWERYRRPLAVTEAHLGCTREEQMRWLCETWQSALDLRAQGVPVRAVTLWAAFGSFDWNSLLTHDDGYYEPGAFDVRAPHPRLTALGALAHDLPTAQASLHPVVATSGWWRRPDRLHYPAVLAGIPPQPAHMRPPAPPLLICGATGTLGKAISKACEVRGLAHHLLGRPALDITSPASIAAQIALYQPWAIINAAGYVRVDDAEDEPEVCMRANAAGPRILAEACAKANIRLVTISSDLVFDGAQAQPYRESDPPHPLNVYGQSKVAGEQAVLQALPEALVIRTAAFFGPDDPYNFVYQVLETLAKGERFVAASDYTITPTAVPDAVHAMLDVLIDGEQGIWHITHGHALTWADLACWVAKLAELDATLVEPRPVATLGWRAPRPVQSALVSERGWLLPPLDEALTHCVAALRR